MFVKTMLVLLLIVLKEAGPAAACSCDVFGSCACSSAGLTSVPQNLSTTATKMDLRYNAITTLTLASISDVDIGGNPWQCDCRMLRFKRLMNGSHDFESQITYHNRSLYCKDHVFPSAQYSSQNQPYPQLNQQYSQYISFCSLHCKVLVFPSTQYSSQK
ncbi:Hypp868 [Branchiostoma lanceolatum]|uniref:Hypp868 protein n=1 Tax=Branchiostoma lanceolatum TaxID=7740 RepID=A0A8J9W5P1_BRALA|nr:Hypp868 [Branchiostoma lanceolatum]